MGLLVNSLSSSYSRPYCFGQKSTSTTNRLKGGRFKRKEKCSLLKQLLIKANLKRQHKKFFLGRGDDDDDDHKKKKRKNSPLSPVSPHALDDHEFYVLHNFQFPLQQQQQQQPVLQQQQQQRRLSDAGSNASSSSRSSSSWPSLGSSIAGIYGSYIGSSPEASSSLSPLSSVAQLSPLSSVDSVLQNGSIITHPSTNETISSLGDNEAVDATYSPEGAASSLSSASNVSPRNYNLRPKTPPTPGHLLVAFRASQPSQQSSSPSASPQQQQEQQQQQMGSPVNIPMAVRPIPIQVQRGQFRPSSTAQEIIAAASSGPSGVGGLVLPSMAPPAAAAPAAAAAGPSGVGQQIAISPQLISPIQSISPLPESPPIFQPQPGVLPAVAPVVVPPVPEQQPPPRQPQQPQQPQRQQQRGRQGRVQRVRARPVPGHNFYNSHFIRALPNLTAQKRKQVLQAAIPQRKRILLNYYRDNNLRIPAMMHSPAPGFAPLVPGSPAVTPPAAAAARGIPPVMSPDNDFTPPRPPRQPRLRRQAPPIPFPQIPNIDNMDDDDVDDIDLLFQNRNRAQIRGNLREILDTYCASDKSQADMRIFNRDYLNSVSDICNNNI